MRGAVPTLPELLALRAAAVLSPFSAEAAERGLRGTIHGVTVREGATPVGMGRIIGNGGCFFVITDIAVDPAHQGQGLGKRIMGALMAHVATLPEGAHVSLLADPPADRLYAQFGFDYTAPRSLGMSMRARRG